MDGAERRREARSGIAVRNHRDRVRAASRPARTATDYIAQKGEASDAVAYRAAVARACSGVSVGLCRCE